jgi:hypothetical protein
MRASKTVESDETFYGRKGGSPKWILHSEFGWRRSMSTSDRMTIVTLVERGGSARSIHVNDLKAATLRAAVLGNADTKSKLMTDDARPIAGSAGALLGTTPSITPTKNGCAG